MLCNLIAFPLDAIMLERIRFAKLIGLFARKVQHQWYLAKLNHRRDARSETRGSDD
jgi:hypothetical protein